MKIQVIEYIKLQLDERMQASWNAMQAAQASANEESKSSAGDKYETARAMGQLDRDMYARQYEQARQERVLIERIEPLHTPLHVSLGALVHTSMGFFFIAVSLGSIKVQGQTVMVVSSQSPIGALLMGKVVGDSFDFRGKKHQIQQIA
ncbi:MAG: transcription elongation factor [Flectobacillus sp.]|uniref:transcription elongation factor n=1 Tax=Flectobacillus sp. TaxID=50419 RepID=UPI003B9D1801